MRGKCICSVVVLFLGLWEAEPGFAQAVGRISGQVLDSTKAAIPRAKVVAEHEGTLVRREAQTDEQGRYALADLAVGSYRISAEAPGFQTQVRPHVPLSVASAVTVDFVLSPGQITETIQVTETVQAVDTNTAAGTYLGSRQILDLPINGRDYARFSLLTPGAVARSNFIADIGFNGLHTVHNNFSIDGVDASRVDQPYMANGFERGARLLTGSLDTIAEVRVQTSNYKAEYGRSAGTSIAIVSRSGTNEVHGGLFEFLRNDFFDARNYFNTKPAPMPKLRYNNFGGNLAGPILQNKTFYFVNYEGSRQRIGITGTGTVPSALMRSRTLATSPELAVILDQYPIGTSSTTNPLVDNYTTTAVNRVREDTGSIRLDHNFSSNDRVYGRLNLNDTEVFGPLFGVIPSALGVNDFQQVPVTTTNAVLNYSRVWSPTVVMDLSMGVQRWGSQINSELPVPQVSITGLTAVVGSRRFSRTNSQVNQTGGSVSWVRGGHTLKAGATYWRSGVNPHNRDLVTIAYTSLEDFINNRVAQATITRGDPGSGRRQDWAGMFIQDTWQVRPGVTMDYGLRYDIGTPNRGERPRYRTFDTRIMALGEPGAPWYAMNKKNFAPRLAVSWQPYSRFVVRTGYGIFYQQYPPGFGYSVAANTIAGNTTLLRAQIPNLSYPVERFIAAGTTPAPNVEGFNWHKPEMYSQQWNLTLIHELHRGGSVQAAYVGNRGINLRRARNINFFDPALGRRPLPQFANVSIEYNDAQSVYHALQVSFTQRLRGGVQGIWNYTLAKVIDNVNDYGLYSTQPQDNGCLGRCERGLGSGDIRHNVTYNVVYELPFGTGRRFLGNARGPLGALVSGWQFSSLGLIRSGIAHFISIGTNTFGNGNLTNQRPDATGTVRPFLSKPTIHRWYNPEAFRMPAPGTFGNAGRNVGRGPDFWQIDASLAKNTTLGESLNMQFRAEVFNLFNRPNFDFPNGVFGTANFGRIFNTFGRTIGFGTSRQIQLALRLRF